DMGGTIEGDIHGPHGEGEALRGQFGMVDTLVAQEFGAPALEEFQIGRMIDIAGKIGVFVIDADGEAMARHGAAPSRTGIRMAICPSNSPTSSADPWMSRANVSHSARASRTSGAAARCGSGLPDARLHQPAT